MTGNYRKKEKVFFFTVWTKNQRKIIKNKAFSLHNKLLVVYIYWIFEI